MEYTVEGMRGVFETPSSKARESTSLVGEEASAADESGHTSLVGEEASAADESGHQVW